MISGSQLRRVLLRASGPALAKAGVADGLANPVLSLSKSTTVIATNDDWDAANPAYSFEFGGEMSPPGSPFMVNWWKFTKWTRCRGW